MLLGRCSTKSPRMHELAVCQQLVRQVEAVAVERKATRVVSIIVMIGPLAGVEAALLRNAYPIASAGSLAADAKLIVEATGVRVRCLECEAESEVPSNRLVCKRCGNWRTQVLSGDELLLKSVELEKESTQHV
jgi:hydrogenase nickel incorporation protein HypA/HybF